MIKFLITILGFAVFIRNYIKGRLISSSSLWTLCYLLIFVLFPVASSEEYSRHDVIDALALIGIVSFFLGALFGSKIKIWYHNDKITMRDRCPSFKIAKIGFITVYILTMILIAQSIGTSGIKAIFAGALTSKQIALSGESSVLEFVQQLLVPCLLCMWISAETYKQKRNCVAFTALYLVEMFFFSFTRLFSFCTLIIILLFVIRNMEKKRQAICIGIATIAMSVLLVVINFVRCLGMGGFQWSDIFNIESFLSGTDFGAAYKYFNVEIQHEPALINPIVYFKWLYCFIPRSLWPGKPETINIQIMKTILPNLVSTGFSAGTSVLGEAYAFLGYIGIALYPFVWGVVCEALDRKYYDRLTMGYDHCMGNILYYIFAVFIVISGQRGDWSLYLIIIVWLYFLPIYLMTKYRVK